MNAIRRFQTIALIVMLLAPGLALLSAYVPNGKIRAWAKVKLIGAVEPITFPPVTLQTLAEGTPQKAWAAWLGRSMGWPRERLIRLNNGAGYAFGLSSVPTIVIGKGKTLYETAYVNEWCRRPARDITATVDDIAQIERMVRASGRAFAMLVSPSKAAIYPERLPAGCHPPDTPREYDQAVALMQARGIALVDGSALMRAARLQQPYPVFGRDGTHWNEFGATLAVQALSSTLAPQLAEPMPAITAIDVKEDNTPWYDEGDLGSLLNLPFKPKTRSPHPVVSTQIRGSAPRLLVVGSSFSWVFLRVMGRVGLMSEADFMYYNKSRALYRNGTLGEFVSGNARETFPASFRRAEAVILELNETNFTGEYVGEMKRELAGITAHTGP